MFSLCLTGAGVLAFVWLGLWQMQRAQDKQALLASYAGASQQQTISLAQGRKLGAASELHPHVLVGGRYDALHSYVLDDQIRDGQRGVLVFAVFEPADGSHAILVNRGFLPRDERSAAVPLPPLETGTQRLSGLYAPPPGSGLRLGGNALPRQQTWPKSTIYIDLAEIEADLGRSLDSGVLLLDPQAGSPFVRNWTPQVMSPDRHYGYAFQWFTFAFAAILIFLALHWRRRPSPIPPEI